MHVSTSSPFWRSFAALALVAAGARAQCDPQWLPGEGWPGVNGSVAVMTTWDPDGAGPVTQKIVVGGTFTVAGPVAATNLAAYDPATGAWSAFGSGVPNVKAVVPLPNGDLVVGGAFTTTSGFVANNLAYWRNGVWSQLGGGVDGEVAALAVAPSGDLVVGGTFWHCGGIAINQLARWNGTTWSAVGPGLSVDSFVTCLASRSDGTLFVGGALVVPGVPGHFVGQWDGTTWSALTVQIVNAMTLAILPNGNLLMGGAFNNLGPLGVHNLAQWDGTSWSGVGTGWFDDMVLGLTVLQSGDVVATGAFDSRVGGPQAQQLFHIARWNGSVWSPVGGGLHAQARATAELPNGDLLVGGRPITAGSPNQDNIARWNGTAWSRVATGFDGRVLGIGALPGADWLVGGFFTTAGATAALRVATGTSGAWTAAGSGIGGILRVVLPVPNGDIVVGGETLATTGVPINGVARWDGTAWQPMGAGLNGSVWALARMPNGDIVAGGSVMQSNGAQLGTCARWNGATWSAIGGLVLGGVMELGVAPNGDLIAAGALNSVGGQPVVGIARWNGAVWSPLGTGVADVNAMTILPNGHIVVASGSTFSSQVKVWNGAFWWNLGGATDWPIHSLVAVHDGAILAGGRFTTIGGVAASRLARWDGIAWSPIGAGVDGTVHAIAVKPSGEIAIGGEFLVANGAVSTHFARLQLPCAPAAAVTGAGCPSSGGTNVLAVESPAWLGSTFRARGTGLPALALVSVITGFTQVSLPLAAFFPQAGAGCDLLVSPDLLWLQVAQNGEVTTSIPLPSTPSLVGATFYHQLNPVEVDSALNIVAITATNALQLTTGLY